MDGESGGSQHQVWKLDLVLRRSEAGLDVKIGVSSVDGHQSCPLVLQEYGCPYERVNFVHLSYQKFQHISEEIEMKHTGRF